MASYSFGNDRNLRKCWPFWTAEKSALALGIIGVVAELINVLADYEQVNLLTSFLGICTCVAIIVAYYKKIPYLYLPFIVYNCILGAIYSIGLAFLIYALISRNETVQALAVAFIISIAGTELDIASNSPYPHAVAWTFIVIITLLLIVLFNRIVYKAYKKSKSNLEKSCLPTTTVGLLQVSSDYDDKPIIIVPNQEQSATSVGPSLNRD